MKKALGSVRRHFQKLDTDKNHRVSDLGEYSKPKDPKDSDSVRIVIISDTHGTKKIPEIVPDGDILIHCGDFTLHGRLVEVESFNEILGSIKHKFKHILVIAGNHELMMDPSLNGSRPEECQRILSNCTYLEDEGIELMGIKFYGTPWHPEHRVGDAFSVKCGEECLSKWEKIPFDTDVLMTHTPPYGVCDEGHHIKHAGCPELLYIVQEKVKPRIHAFGHIHEAYGIAKDKTTTYLNASICTRRYRSDNLPFVIDLKPIEKKTVDFLPNVLDGIETI
ncbi:metallophosphoesterase domain-containing protein 1-like [Clytia hemisphaerica]|uniref:Calcineurin-like phosphoesterase domain-containing protein n=1 Tax=Clytia hemisphaerica TaxID=252671 RepID=A0A7M5WL78_9CNID